MLRLNSLQRVPDYCKKTIEFEARSLATSNITKLLNVNLNNDIAVCNDDGENFILDAFNEEN